MRPLHAFFAGDTYDPVFTWLGDDGLPADLTGTTITSQVRTETDALVSEATVEILNQTTNRGQFRLVVASATTATWPPGTLVCNARLAFAGGVVRSTELWHITVQRPPTRPA